MSSSLLPSDGAVGWTTTANNAISAPQLNGFRLTLTMGTPVTTADVPTSTSAFLSPYTSDRICLFDGTNWQEYSTNGADVTIDFTKAANNLTMAKNYDLFVYDSGGSVTFDTPVAWTGDTTRATSVTRQNGVWVKSGDATRRYVGTVRATASNTATDGASQRLVWNVNNRVVRSLVGTGDTGATYSYTTATWRAQNSNTTVGQARVQFVVGLVEDLVTAFNHGIADNNTNCYCGLGIGIDSTSANSAQIYGGQPAASGYGSLYALYRGYPSAFGFHYIQQLEISQATGTTNWSASAASSGFQKGIVAETMG